MKILLIEDELEIAQFLIRVLKNASFEVVHYDSGKKAYNSGDVLDADVIILDLMLDGEDGADLLKKIRKMVMRILKIGLRQ